MEQLLLVAFAAAVPLVLYLWFRRAPRAAAGRPPATVPTATSLATPSALAADPPVAGQTVPPELQVFTWRRLADLTDDQRQALLVRHRHVPRPPRLLSQLLSREFVNEASASELAELIGAEPLLAARVLKAVNAPYYGLARPVSSIAQAVSLLGLTAVRIVCLRYIFIASFKTDDPLRQQALQQSWTASALASELTQRLAAGEIDDLARHALDADLSPELFHLRHSLGPARLARVAAVLQDPTLAQGLRRIAAGT